MEYYKRGQKHAFIVLIKRGLSEAAKSTRKSTSTSNMFVSLNSLLAAHYIAEGIASDKKKASDYLEEATDCLNEAERRNPNNSEEYTIRKGKKV